MKPEYIPFTNDLIELAIREDIGAGAALLTTAFGCDNADLGAIDNAAYIAEAQKETSSTVEVGNDGATASLTARLGGKADGEYSFRIEADPEVLERFNA